LVSFISRKYTEPMTNLANRKNVMNFTSNVKTLEIHDN